MNIIQIANHDITCITGLADVHCSYGKRVVTPQEAMNEYWKWDIGTHHPDVFLEMYHIDSKLGVAYKVEPIYDEDWVPQGFCFDNDYSKAIKLERWRIYPDDTVVFEDDFREYSEDWGATVYDDYEEIQEIPDMECDRRIINHIYDLKENIHGKLSGVQS
jgi:hypothetical protein